LCRTTWGGHRDALEVAGQSPVEGTERFFHVHAQCIRIDGFNAVNRRIVGAHPRLDLRVEDAVDISLGRLGIEVRAIVEFDALGEVEDPRPAVILDLP
jgi:hypothetical protein